MLPILPAPDIGFSFLFIFAMVLKHWSQMTAPENSYLNQCKSSNSTIFENCS